VASILYGVSYDNGRKALKYYTPYSILAASVPLPAERYRRVWMTIERIVRIVAGLFVLLSLGLGVKGSPLFVNENFLWFTAFVGANLFQSGFTRLCPLDAILRRLGVKSGDACG